MCKESVKKQEAEEIPMVRAAVCLCLLRIAQMRPYGHAARNARFSRGRFLRPVAGLTSLSLPASPGNRQSTDWVSCCSRM